MAFKCKKVSAELKLMVTVELKLMVTAELKLWYLSAEGSN